MSEIGTKKKTAHALRDARGERQLSSQARECLAALKRYNNMALAQILKQARKENPVLSEDQCFQTVVEKKLASHRKKEKEQSSATLRLFELRTRSSGCISIWVPDDPRQP